MNRATSSTPTRRVRSEKTVTGIVDRLVRRRLVQRDRSLDDRRIIRCRLTRPGERAAERLDGAISQAMHLLLSMLEREDRHHLVRILETLQQRMDKAAA